MATPSPAPDQQSVLAANQRFYEVLSAMDLAAMETVWLPEDWVRCVHPGWAQLEGWPAVRESWLHIFENTKFLRVTITQAAVHLEQDMAWVSCVERVSSSGEGRIDLALVQATNLFVRRDGAWRMVLHHASHLPVAMPAEGEETVH